MRQRQIGGVKRRKLDEPSADDGEEALPAESGHITALQAETGSASDTRGLSSEGLNSQLVEPQTRQGAPGPAEPGGLQEFSRMLTMSRGLKLEVCCFFLLPSETQLWCCSSISKCIALCLPRDGDGTHSSTTVTKESHMCPAGDGLNTWSKPAHFCSYSVKRDFRQGHSNVCLRWGFQAHLHLQF